jgi:hypothetical protein
MTCRVPYRQRKSAARLLLLAGYLVFFSTQFNSRYYDIANFFVYKRGNAVVKTTLTQQGNHGLNYHINAQRPAHLSIDKRFSFRSAIKPAFTDFAPPAPSYIIISRKALPPPVVYSNPDLLTNALRGPPTLSILTDPLG